MRATTFSQRRAAFRKLHEAGCFMLPNPWDAGSASALATLGFKALATTSSGAAWSQARPDHGMDVEAVLEHCRRIVAATDLPVNADFESGYARDIDALKNNVRRCVETGVAGLSIEDSSGDDSQPLFELDEAIARLRAARAAIDATGEDVVLVGRAECYLVGHADALNESIKRLRAYAQAGADCLYAPGVRDPEHVRAIVRAVAPKPVNVPAAAGLASATVRRKKMSIFDKAIAALTPPESQARARQSQSPSLATGFARFSASRPGTSR